MSNDDSFDPDTVDDRIIELLNSTSQDQDHQDSHQRLITNLQLLYQNQQMVDTTAVERIKRRVAQRSGEKAFDKSVSPADKILYMPHSRVKKYPRGTQKTENTTKSSRSQKYTRYLIPSFLVAILLIVVIPVGNMVFKVSSPTVKHTRNSNGSTAALSISIEPQAVIYQESLYVNTGADIRAYSHVTGKLEHTYAVSSAGDPTIINGILYSSGLNSTSAIRISDGKLLWQSPMGSTFLNPPLIVNNVLYGSTAWPNKTIYALQVSNGHVIWQYHLVNRNEGLGTPVVAQNSIYFIAALQGYSSSSTTIYKLNARDGNVQWQHTSASGNEAITELQTDGLHLYTIIDGYVKALQSSDGGVLWSYKLPISSSLEIEHTYIKAIVNGVMYIAGGNGSVYALQTASGSLLWQYQTNTPAQFGAFDVQRDVVYIGMLSASPLSRDLSSVIVAIRISNGSYLWRSQLTKQAIISPTAQQGIVYTIYGTGTMGLRELVALDASDGHIDWHNVIY